MFLRKKAEKRQRTKYKLFILFEFFSTEIKQKKVAEPRVQVEI